jgi:hypothetical protein
MRILGGKPISVALVAVALLAGAAPAAAIEPYTYTVSLMVGLGGSLDADPGDDLGQRAFQLGVGALIEERTLLWARFGLLDLDIDEGFGSLTSAELRYLTLAGEYRSRRPFYDMGVYLGVGGYQLEGRRPDGSARRDTAPGAAFGVTGDFRLNRSWSIQVELSGHWADLDEANLFAIAHAGVAVKF